MTDDREIKKLLAHGKRRKKDSKGEAIKIILFSYQFSGRYVAKEIETLYALKKYRAMKKRYYDE